MFDVRTGGKGLMKYFFLFITTIFIACSDDNATSPGKENYEEVENGLISQSLEHDGQTRRYFTYVPEGNSESNPFPVLFNFHGGSGNATGQIYTADFRTIADTAKFILIYPEGLYGDWNMSLPGDSDSKNSTDDYGFIEKMIVQLSNSYAVDEKRIYAVGFSNGGGMAHGLAASQSSRFAAIVSMAGNLYKNVADNSSPSPTSILTIHGTLDGSRPYYDESLLGGYYYNIENMHSYWVDKNQCNETPTESTFFSSGSIIHQTFENCSDGHSIEHYKVMNGGHYWLSFFQNNIPTNQIIWNFLSRFDINGKIN